MIIRLVYFMQSKELLLGTDCFNICCASMAQQAAGFLLPPADTSLERLFINQIPKRFWNITGYGQHR